MFIKIMISIFFIVYCTNSIATNMIEKNKKEILKIINQLENSDENVNDLQSSIYSVVNIRIKSDKETGPIKNRSTVMFGTGVLVAPNLVLTNNHVLRTRDALDRAILFVNHRTIKENVSKKRDTNSYLLKTDSDQDRLFYTSSTLDFTIFEIEPVKNPNIKFATGFRKISEYDNSIYILSYPLGHTLIADRECKGIANEVEIKKYAKKYSHNLRKEMIYHLCDSYPGSSGAPIFDVNGKLLGIHRKSFYQNGVADMNMAVPYSEIVKHMSISSNDASSITDNDGLESAVKSELEWGIKSILLRLPPGHELITTEAIRNTNNGFIQKENIVKAIINGNISVDYPVYWGILPNIIELYNSHYGKDQYKHSMLVRNDQTKKQILKIIHNYLTNEVEQFIRMDKFDREDAARGIGRILHTIQDSYSEAHTKRKSEEIQEFFFYSEQDKENHKSFDMVTDANTGNIKKNAMMAITQSMSLLDAAYNSSMSSRKEKMMLVINSVFGIKEEKTIEFTATNFDPNETERGLESGRLHPMLASHNPLRNIHKKIKKSIGNEVHRPIKCCPPSRDDL